MNEVTKSVLRRAQALHDTAACNKTFPDGLTVDEKTFRAFAQDIFQWAQFYPISIEGVKINVKWDKSGRLP